jgi:hypothetical protein
MSQNGSHDLCLKASSLYNNPHTLILKSNYSCVEFWQFANYVTRVKSLAAYPAKLLFLQSSALRIPYREIFTNIYFPYRKDIVLRSLPVGIRYKVGGWCQIQKYLLSRAKRTLPTFPHTGKYINRFKKNETKF